LEGNNTLISKIAGIFFNQTNKTPGERQGGLGRQHYVNTAIWRVQV